MIIDIFKSDLFKGLEQYNQEILDVCKNWNYNNSDEEYDFQNKKVSKWFDPEGLNRIYIPLSYPRTVPLTSEPKFCLQLYCCNYASLFLIDTLFSHRKDILIEDVGSGMGILSFYLSKLGFNNFSFIDNFSQIAEPMFRELMEKAEIKSFELNNIEIISTVMNQVALPEIVKTPDKQVELYCFYNNGLLPLDKIQRAGFKFLCRDNDNLMYAWCREDKYDEFASLLHPYEV